MDQHFIREESFVYSVPFDAGETTVDPVVTASHAIFHTEGGKSAPAAVVGFQFQHSALHKLFRNITGNVRLDIFNTIHFFRTILKFDLNIFA